MAKNPIVQLPVKIVELTERPKPIPSAKPTVK